MAKRALLIGCNYPGTKTPLLGSANDAEAMKSLLEEVYAFDPATITVLTDSSSDASKQPTSANIKKSLEQMVAAAEPGDSIFVHFSGHGVQLPVEAGEGEEEVDGLDEAIVPSDLNPILDNDLREIFTPLKKGVVLTVVTDCCHSGGLLDHEEAPVGGGKWKYPEVPEMKLGTFFSLLGLKPSTASLDVSKMGENKLKYRTMSQQELLNGLSPGAKEKVRQVIHNKFGEETSSKIRNYLNYGVGGAKVASRAVQKVRTQGCLATILGFLGLNKPAGEERPDFILPGQKPPKSDQLKDDVGILITACQSDEKAADCNVSGNKKKAGGALTNALITVVREHTKGDPEKPLTNRALVMAVKNTLAAGGFAQSPGLEGSTKNADSEFITGKEVNV